MKKPVLDTIGHSTRPLADFLELLVAQGFVARCHRSLIADALAVDGWRVLHIQSRNTAKLHRRTRFLPGSAGRLLYPKPARTDARR